MALVDGEEIRHGLVTDNDGHVIPSTLGNLINFTFDYIAVTYPDGDTEVYTYKLGGASGSTTGTITVNYTDSTKADILNIART